MLPFPSSLFPSVTASNVPPYGTDEELAEQTTTGVELTGAEVTIALASNTDYMFLWSQDVQTDSTLSPADSDIEIGGSTIFTVRPTITPREVGSPIDYQTMGGMFRVQEGSSPSLVTHRVKGKRGASAANLKIRNSRLSYVKLSANDVYAESIARQTWADPTNKTKQTAATLSLTGGGFDWLILASFLIDKTAGTNTDYLAELTDGTTSAGDHWAGPAGPNDRCPMMICGYFPAASGAKTYSLKVQQPNTGSCTIGISEIRMLAIRLDRYTSFRQAKIFANSTGSDSTYVTAVSQTFTPNAGDFLSIASWNMASSSTTASAYSQFLDGADTVNEFIREFGTATDRGVPAVSHRLATYAASSRTQAIQRHGEGAVNNVVKDLATINCLELTGIT